MIAALSLRALPWAAAAAAVVAAYHFSPIIGPQARLERLAHDREAWRAASREWERSAGEWKAAFHASEAMRKREQGAAVEAVIAATTQCDARVKQARASAKAIKEIAYAPIKTDPAGCAVRGVVGADRLRDALQAAAGR